MVPLRKTIREIRGKRADMTEHQHRFRPWEWE
jgi:hypothetical protein